MNVTVCCLPQDIGEDSYRVRVDWKDDSFNVLLLHEGSAWSGHASSDHVKQLSRSLDVSIAKYMDEVKTVLSTKGGASNFTYIIEDGKFIWKKQDQETKIKIKYGYICLEKASVIETAEKMLDSLLEQCSGLEAQVTQLQEINTRTTKEKNICMEKLVEYKTQKLQVEKVLLSKFLAVLNAKKECIQRLQDKLSDKVSANSHGEDADTDDPKPSHLHTRKAKQAENESDHYDSETEVEEDTDEGETASTPPRTNVTLFDDDLFQDTQPSVSTIPKRTARPKRPPVELTKNSVAGPSRRKVTRQSLDNGSAAEFSTQNLLDEL